MTGGRRRTFCLKIVDDTLKKVFWRLGDCVGRRPGYFLIVPALVTALCASGFQRMDYSYDPEYLMSPTQGAAKQERAVMEQYFPVNYQYFQVHCQSKWKHFQDIIIELYSIFFDSRSSQTFNKNFSCKERVHYKIENVNRTT